jgi:hypothetical protein
MLILLFTLLSTVALLLLANKLRLFRDREVVGSILHLAITDRESVRLGIVAAAMYVAVFMIFGGQGGRIHVFWGRWILTMTAGDAVLGVFIAFLIGLAVVLISYSIKAMGLPKAGKGGIGVLGTALAMLASFCP